MIRIVLVDDHHLVREGLRLVLNAQHDLDVVAQAATHDDAFELAVTKKPDVLLLDLGLPDGDGIQLIRMLRTRQPNLRILVVTMDRSAETVRQALAAGASGYVVKGARSSELIDAVHAVARGERYLHSSVTAAIVDDAVRLVDHGQVLSARQIEVVSQVAAGLPPALVAEKLGISAHTVRRHITNISAKLGLSGVALIQYVIENDLIRDL